MGRLQIVHAGLSQKVTILKTLVVKIIMLAASIVESVMSAICLCICPISMHTYRDSPGGSM